MTGPVAAGLSALGPRRPETARTWATLMVAIATVTFLSLTFVGGAGPTRADILVAIVMSLMAAVLAALPASRTGPLCLLTALAAVVVITALDIATDDASVAGQVFFCLPVLYAATQHRVAGAVLVTACAVVGEAVVVLTLLPTEVAVVDLTFVGTTLTLTAWMLVRAGVAQDLLVARLREQAAIDPVTRLVTRRVLDDATQCAITGSHAHEGTALVLVDVDRFKRINDTHGHVVGDDALCHVAALLTSFSRPQDVVARMGGDELAVLMPGCSYGVAVRRAESFVEAVRASPLQLPDGALVTLSISAGAAHVPEHATRARDLYATADAALYVAKRGGRGRVGLVPDPAG